MKTKEELNALKEKVETLSKKLAELSEDELEQVAGGTWDYGLLDIASIDDEREDKMKESIVGANIGLDAFP